MDNVRISPQRNNDTTACGMANQQVSVRAKNTASCRSQTNAVDIVVAVDNRSYCCQWYCSCDKETIYTKDGADILYFNLSLYNWIVVTNDVTTKFYIIPDGDQFYIVINEDGKCLELLGGRLLSLSECADTVGQLF